MGRIRRNRIPFLLIATGSVAALGLTILSGRTADAVAPLKTAAVALRVAGAEPTPLSGPSDFEREAIFSLVRDHRTASDENWQRELAEAIYSESVQANIDPLIIASIVAKESSFRPTVVSHAGAVGLMQIRPFVAEELAMRREIEWNGVETLHRPNLNVRIGIQYYKELLDRFDGDANTALTAYNYGPTRVSRQLRRGTFDGSRYADGILGMYETLNAARLSSEIVSAG